MKKILLALAMSACAAAGNARAADDWTSINVSVLHGEQQESAGSMVVRNDRSASVGHYYEYPVAHAHLDGTPFSEAEEKAADFAGSWQLVIDKVTLHPDGSRSLSGTLDEHAPGWQPEHQVVAFDIKVGDHTATIHGANGADYLLTIR
ncbi:hypothetical protein [Paraburkholderia sp. SIMBA_054]|uniref:hypothetical protein n=1 Tax=Paraburkholderia sp. SIMBA_054 TaxID=3085795 RepID=UPI00397B6C62